MNYGGTEERIRLAAVLALAAGLALWLDCSALHGHHNSDSLVPVLVSLDRWTPFYWGQNRFGMLVPLLALPVRDPFTNLLVQVGLRLLALVLSFFLLARTVVPRPWWPAIGGLTLALFLAGKEIPQHNFQQMQPYFQALALALGGVALLDRRGGRVAVLAAAGLLALAFWVSPTTLFWLVPLLWLRRVLGLEPGTDGPRFRPPALPLLLAGLGFGASLAASRLSEYGRATVLGPARPADWPEGWLALARNGMAYLSPALVAAIVLLLAVAVGLSLARHRMHPALAAGLCLLGTAAAELLILGTTGWVHANGFRLRFLSTVLLAVATAGSALLLGLLLEGRPARWGRTANALVLAALLPLTWARYGLPSLAVARAALDDGLARTGEIGRPVAAAGCTHVLGDYWRVWPAVFHANLLLAGRGEGRRVWGITHRSAPTWPLWRRRDWRRARIAVLGTPRQVERLRAIYRLPPLGVPGGIPVCSVP